MEIKMASMTCSYNIVLLPKSEDIIKVTTTVTNDVKVAMNWIKEIRDPGPLGLEVQCCSHNSKLPAILTLVAADHCLILQLCHLGLQGDKEGGIKIKDLLLPVKGFAGANLEHSISLLKREYGINVADNTEYLDIISDSATGGLFSEKYKDSAFETTVGNLMMELIIMRKKKPQVESAVWEKEKLEEDLVAYATLESYLYYIFGWSSHLQAILSNYDFFGLDEELF